jgi:glutamine amidotransferase
MRQLQQRDLISVLRDYAATGKPLLGICLGMQLLLDSSLEFGHHAGLGLIAGTVEPFALDPSLKVPHIGWNLSRVPESFPERDTHPVFQPLTARPQHFYYVHSFVCRPASVACIALEADYGGWFPGALADRNLIATQFHPEKSQADGLELLRRFAAWQPQSAVPPAGVK